MVLIYFLKIKTVLILKLFITVYLVFLFSFSGIVLSWNMALGSQYADIESYQLFAYQESAAPPSAGLWKKVGDVKALPLPMACTLTQVMTIVIG